MANDIYCQHYKERKESKVSEGFNSKQQEEDFLNEKEQELIFGQKANNNKKKDKRISISFNKNKKVKILHGNVIRSLHE